MVRLVGRSSFLFSCRLGQYSRRCSVVSAGLSEVTPELVCYFM